MTLGEMATLPRAEFKAASVSDNTNSFGLRGVILMARDGEAFEVGITSQFAPKKGDLVRVPYDEGGYVWGYVHVEIPRCLGKAPKGVVAEVWAA